MLRSTHSAGLLALVVLIGGCADAGEEEGELQESAVEQEVAAAPDLASWDKDGNALLADAEWDAYLMDRMPWYVWDADQSGALEQREFESGAVSAAAGASFSSWDADASGGVDGSEWAASWRALYDENQDGGVSAEELGSEI